MSTGDQSRAAAAALLERHYVAWFSKIVQPALAAPMAELGLLDVLDDPRLCDATRVVLRGVQEDLLRLESPVDFQVARSLMRQRLWALTWWIDHKGHRAAKQVVLELADGAPLTLCMGDVCRPGSAKPEGRWKKKTVATYGWGEVGFTVQGCRAVIPDSTHSHGGEMWRRFCHDCSNDNRRPHRDQAREVRRRLDAARRPENATVYVGLPHENAIG